MLQAIRQRPDWLLLCRGMAHAPRVPVKSDRRCATNVSYFYDDCVGRVADGTVTGNLESGGNHLVVEWVESADVTLYTLLSRASTCLCCLSLLSYGD